VCICIYYWVDDHDDDDDDDDDDDRTNRRARKIPCPSATFSTTNPTYTGLGSYPDLRGKRPATNRLSHNGPVVLGDIS
jgi:hypothetical protein